MKILTCIILLILLVLVIIGLVKVHDKLGIIICTVLSTYLLCLFSVLTAEAVADLRDKPEWEFDRSNVESYRVDTFIDPEINDTTYVIKYNVKR